MAVAVKTSPGPKSSKTPPSPALYSVVGVVYVVVCLALLFKVFPALFWSGWDALGWSKAVVQGGALLLTLSCFLGALFLYVGAQFSDERAPAGIRAGTFVGLCGVLLILLLTRWASVWIEHWAYQGAFDVYYGTLITSGFSAALLIIGLRVFFTDWAQSGVLAFEESGWFTTKEFKGNQGKMVRWGTILGILMITGAGIYTVLSTNMLRRFGPDLALNIPFTGKVAIEGFGDGQENVEKDVPASAIPAVEVRYPGSTTLRPGQKMSIDAYRAGLTAILETKEDETLPLRFESRSKLEEALKLEPVQMTSAINRVIYSEIEHLLDNNAFSADTAKRLQALSNETSWADMTRLVEFVLREAKTENVKVGGELSLPIAVVLADRFAMRPVFNTFAPPVEGRPGEFQKTMIITYPGALEDPPQEWKPGQLVTDKELKDAIKELKEDQSKPLAREAISPHGPLRYETVVLLPAIQYTLPLLMIVGSLWLAWRAVNMPAFAEFLIATEAELNKVSWTTQKRLYQDTIVVLVTVFLMAVFLFSVDIGWKYVLQFVRVLYIPPDAPQVEISKKKW